MSQAGRRPSMALARLRSLRTWFRWLTAEGEIASDPTARVPTPRLGRATLPAFSVEQAERLLDACRTSREKALGLFMLDSGVGAAELCAVEVRDVDGHSAIVNTVAPTLFAARSRPGRWTPRWTWTRCAD
jgi:integrase/recombinase XerD